MPALGLFVAKYRTVFVPKCWLVFIGCCDSMFFWTDIDALNSILVVYASPHTCSAGSVLWICIWWIVTTCTSRRRNVNIPSSQPHLTDLTFSELFSLSWFYLRRLFTKSTSVHFLLICSNYSCKLENLLIYIYIYINKCMCLYVVAIYVYFCTSPIVVFNVMTSSIMQRSPSVVYDSSTFGTRWLY